MIGDVARDNVRVLSRGNLFKAVDESEVELQLGQGLEGRSLPTGFLRILLLEHHVYGKDGNVDPSFFKR